MLYCTNKAQIGQFFHVNLILVTDAAGKSTTFQVEALTAHGHKVFVGTSGGTVGVFNSETFSLMKSFSWYTGKVQLLLVMPKEAEHCICAEIPYNEQSLPFSQEAPRQKMLSAVSQNKMFTLNREPEAVVITSIGKGRRNFELPSSLNEGAPVKIQKQDVCLRLWRASC